MKFFYYEIWLRIRSCTQFDISFILKNTMYSISFMWWKNYISVKPFIYKLRMTA